MTAWEDGTRARTTARSFSIETDEPKPLGGTDRAVDPMELLLASLGTCLTIGWTTQAAKRGVDFRALRIEVNGDYDLRGYLDLDDAIRPGFIFAFRETRAGAFGPGITGGSLTPFTVFPGQTGSTTGDG